MSRPPAVPGGREPVGTIDSMDLTTELLDNAAFHAAKRGGYSTQDVDEFIEQVKASVEHSDAELRDLRQRVQSADARVAEAERRAVEAERSGGPSEADETLKRTLVLAQRTADAAIKEAEEQAARTLSSAQDQAARMLAEAKDAAARAQAEAENEARRAQEEARARVLAELRELEFARDQLQVDVDAFERHLQQQRDRVQVAAQELQRLVEDPTALREATAPNLSEVSLPNQAAAAPAVLDLEEPAAEAVWAPDEEAWEEAAPVADGPTTEPVDMLAERAADDDAYLAELRKAMTDESPLGPREDDDSAFFDTAPGDAGRSRFGRRR